MLKIVIPAREAFDERTQTFINCPSTTLVLEHSLVSVSKWEAKWHKPYLDDSYKKTRQQDLDYIKCMTITQNVPDEVYLMLTRENRKAISDYINDSNTATFFNSNKRTTPKRSNEKITSELIYYWMFSYGIPIEAQKWHLNRLFTLIRIFGIKGDSGNKMSKQDTLKQYAAIKAARRKK